jgi:hypothetical protein
VAAYAAKTIIRATGAPVSVLAAARVAAYVDPRINDAVADDLRGLLALNLGSFPEPGATLDPGEAGPLGPLWPARLSDRARGVGSATRQSTLTIHA